VYWQGLWGSFVIWHLPLLTVPSLTFPLQPSREVLWKWHACEMPLSPPSWFGQGQGSVGKDHRSVWDWGN
jgi:hypothetical protein